MQSDASWVGLWKKGPSGWAQPCLLYVCVCFVPMTPQVEAKLPKGVRHLLCMHVLLGQQ